jgi:hypothetical protein
MAATPLSAKKMPLPVEIFCAAMERQVPLADYARNIDIHPDILQDVLTGRLNDADPHSVNSLAKAIDRDPEQIDLTTAPFHESFGTWLKRNMEGITQHALRARTQLDTRTLKRFLNGEILPDSDQAERISRALYIDRMEIARVVTANMAAASPPIPSQEPAQPKATARQSTVRHAETPATVSTELGTSDIANQAVAGTQRRRASTIKKRRQPTMEESPAIQSVDPVAVDRANETVLPAPARAKTVTETEAGTRRPKRSTTRDLASTAAAEQAPVLTETTLAPEDRSVAGFAAVDTRPKQASSRRRPRTTEPEVTDISTSGERHHGQVGDTTGMPTAQSVVPHARHEADLSAPVVSENASRASHPDALAAEVSSSLTAESALSMPDQRSADITADRMAPLVTAELAADTTTLQLSPDEVRLIRHWRQLHPHGRRATLHYIGSLLVDA